MQYRIFRPGEVPKEVSFDVWEFLKTGDYVLDIKRNHWFLIQSKKEQIAKNIIVETVPSNIRALALLYQ